MLLTLLSKAKYITEFTDDHELLGNIYEATGGCDDTFLKHMLDCKDKFTIHIDALGYESYHYYFEEESWRDRSYHMVNKNLKKQ